MQLVLQDKCRIQAFDNVLDYLSVQLQRRRSCYIELYDLSGFITDFESMTLLEVRLKVTHLANMYPVDLELSFVD